MFAKCCFHKDSIVFDSAESHSVHWKTYCFLDTVRSLFRKLHPQILINDRFYNWSVTSEHYPFPCYNRNTKLITHLAEMYDFPKGFKGFRQSRASILAGDCIYTGKPLAGLRATYVFLCISNVFARVHHVHLPSFYIRLPSFYTRLHSFLHSFT